jgi:triacylglycerol esterase/lipase EstA (alpha/beta hydrolase family)
MRLHKILLLAVILFASITIKAESLLLIHGYQGTSKDWFDSGIVSLLEKNSWTYSGNLVVDRQGKVRTQYRKQKKDSQHKRKIYTVSVPSEAPIHFQARYLKAITENLARKDEKISLAGHSAGGISARMLMVLNPDLPILHLVTIATPHLGTDTANIGALAGKTPLTMMAPFMGANTFNRSQGLYHDLKREQPNTFLYWLNRRKHPKAQYVSIVHIASNYSITDKMLAPAESQDMNNVYALHEKARTIKIRSGHSLTIQDGQILVDLLK